MDFPFTQDQIDKRTSDYVCFECGVQFLTPEQKSGNRFHAVTFHMGDCCLCRKHVSVTSIRHYNRLRLPLTLNTSYNE